MYSLVDPLVLVFSKIFECVRGYVAHRVERKSRGEAGRQRSYNA